MYASLIKAQLRGGNAERRTQLFSIPRFDGVGAVALVRPLSHSHQGYSRLSLTYRAAQSHSHRNCVANAIADAIEYDYRSSCRDFSIAAQVDELAVNISRCIRRRQSRALHSPSVVTGSAEERVLAQPVSFGEAMNAVKCIVQRARNQECQFLCHSVSAIHESHYMCLTRTLASPISRDLPPDAIVTLALFPFVAAVEVCPSCAKQLAPPKACSPFELPSTLPYLFSDPKETGGLRRCDNNHTVTNECDVATHAVVISNLGIDGHIAPAGRAFICDRVFRGLEATSWPLGHLLNRNGDSVMPGGSIFHELVRVHVKNTHMLCRLFEVET